MVGDQTLMNHQRVRQIQVRAAHVADVVRELNFPSSRLILLVLLRDLVEIEPARDLILPDRYRERGLLYISVKGAIGRSRQARDRLEILGECISVTSNFLSKRMDVCYQTKQAIMERYVIIDFVVHRLPILCLAHSLFIAPRLSLLTARCSVFKRQLKVGHQHYWTYAKTDTAVFQIRRLIITPYFLVGDRFVLQRIFSHNDKLRIAVELDDAIAASDTALLLDTLELVRHVKRSLWVNVTHSHYITGNLRCNGELDVLVVYCKVSRNVRHVHS